MNLYTTNINTKVFSKLSLAFTLMMLLTVSPVFAKEPAEEVTAVAEVTVEEETVEEVTEEEIEEVEEETEEETEEVEEVEEPVVTETAQASTTTYTQQTYTASSAQTTQASTSYTTSTASSDPLTKQKGVVYYNGHRETYYSQKVLPGGGLDIPGRHVAEDGTVRDADGYICVASSDYSKGTVVETSLGTAKVYDSGCASGTVDIYTNW